MSSNFSFPAPPSKSTVPKLHISAGALPTFVDPKQPPTKHQPWRLIRETPFIKSVNLIIPNHLYEAIWPSSLSSPSTQASSTTNSTSSQQQYPTRIEAGTCYKIILKLSDVLCEPFFNHYIKTGNLLMISEGKPGIDDFIFTLHNGVLRMDLSRAVYERTGIQGQVVRNNGGGKKHGKERWKVEVNLRSDSMKKGKKGFERLLRASREVFDRGLVWVVRDVQKEEARREKKQGVKRGSDGEVKTETTSQETQQLPPKPVPEPILSFAPTIVTLSPTVRIIHKTPVPGLVSSTALFSHLISSSNPSESTAGALPLETHDDYYELLEYLDMIVLDSPQIPSPAASQTKIDPYLSRYQIPSPSQNSSATDLRVLEWGQGLIDSGWIINLLSEIIRRSRTQTTKSSSISSTHQNPWAALTVTSHRIEASGQTDGYTILLQSQFQSPSQLDDDHNKMDVDGNKLSSNDHDTKVQRNSNDEDDDDNKSEKDKNVEMENSNNTGNDNDNDNQDPNINMDTTKTTTTTETKTEGLNVYISFQHVDS